MAGSTRSDTQQPSASKTDRGPDEKAEVAMAEEDALREAEYELDLGHAHLRAECWAGASVAASDGNCRSVGARPRPALRLQRLARHKTPRHRSRPRQRANERFTADDREFLVD